MDEQAHNSVMTMAMCPGMTLRDWFAGQALNRLPAERYDDLGIWTGEVWDQGSQAANCAYAQADAMLKVRAENPPEESQIGPKNVT